MFFERYLRSPNSDDISRLLAMGSNRGFLGMLGSIDCMHWKWKNCPTTQKGMYFGHIHEPTIILEAVASQDLWIWHDFFGMPGSHNDINVLDRSFVISLLTQGRAPPVNYSINGNDYTMRYYLADGIYPQWATFVKIISFLQGNKQIYFAKAQESTRKDVERAFGVLQARFAIIQGPVRFWKMKIMEDIMMACIIIHNMIVYTMRYYLADGIYPQWATFVKIISFLQGNKQIYFAKAQESARKDVERAFGVLQARFAIIQGPVRFWKTKIMEDIMMACIIMHNMIVEDERNANGMDFNYDTISESLPPVSHERTP
ncbi:uncharacterized protein LOC114297279 [Camellia sinensis]|uniref:uncharacterized protein LOC114297279 n=1 Tax=Camellia sinensis TaxID=4442 RepID=UPI00103588F5|nr:uncharacterized protein LOC114297279 [Camellia sinensis]